MLCNATHTPYVTTDLLVRGGISFLYKSRYTNSLSFMQIAQPDFSSDPYCLFGHLPMKPDSDSLLEWRLLGLADY